MCVFCYNNLQKEATEYTKKINRNFAKKFGINLEHADCSEYELATRNQIKSARGLKIETEAGNTVWDLNQFSFYENDAVSDTIHPSLWLNGKSCYSAGVFEVVKDAIYQVRGLDLSNLTIIKGKTGWIVQDVMTTVETARKALDLLSEALHTDVRSNVKAVIISHSHWDHFGGIKGVVDEENVGNAEEGKIPIYVPAGFDEECIKEYIFAGTAMDRRNDYQFGRKVGSSEKGVVSGGLGIDHPKGTASFITPTNRIEKNQTLFIDGLEIEFQLTPGTEAPAEMNNYFKDYRALWIAENCCGTLHNLYPIRGAQLRDSSAWANYIQEAILLFADRSDVVFQSHHWPHYNTKEEPDGVKQYLLNNAAFYRYLHDQTLYLANKGLTAKEIAKKIEISEKLATNWFTRPYYGSVEINARAVYTKYLGFYNANPVELDPLTELQEAKLFVDYAGPEEKILKKAEKDFLRGEYKKAANVTNKLVIANPENKKARQLCADAFEQLAYQSESSIWRNAYLQGAYELRNGVGERKLSRVKNKDMMYRMSPKYMLEYIGTLIDGKKAGNKELKLNLIFVNDNAEGTEKTVYQGKEVTVEQKFYVHLYYGALLSYENYQKDEEDVVNVILPKQVFFKIAEKQIESVKDKIDTNDFEKLLELEAVIEDLNAKDSFPIIERTDSSLTL